MKLKKRYGSGGYLINKVWVDTGSYTGKDVYSDGSIEDEILEIVKNGKEREAVACDGRWPILYHLSNTRENLLNWFEFSRDASVLEVGMGCGAITGLLCRNVKKVETVEISPRRAEIAAWRHNRHKNLCIHVGNLNDIEFGQKFDYLTLIGVLEYAGTFTHTDAPYKDFLENCRTHLKPGGMLLLAIENRLGLKYWSGAREDHTGRLFDGIMNYPENNGIRTFAKPELEALLHSSGYRELEWYYPFPDYKLPYRVFSDDYLPRAGDIRGNMYLYYDQPKYDLFEEDRAMDGIIQSGLFDIFSNSFLVCCKNGGTL